MSELSVAEVLNRAADLIEPEGAWMQGALARDASGNYVGFDAPEAVCFCASGAINRVTGLSSDKPACDSPMFEPVRSAFEAATNGERPMPFNDTPGRTQAEVVAALRQAAARLASTPPRVGEG